MNEEVFNKKEADELTQRIVNRLGERQKKLEQMEKWERPATSARLRPLYVTLAIAACVAAVFLISPLWNDQSMLLEEMGIGRPDLTEYRAASPEITKISQLMDSEDYGAALDEAERALIRSDESVKMLYSVYGLWEKSDDESIEYELELECNTNSELRWTYIYLLVKQGKYRKAKKELKQYLKDSQYCKHEAEAKALLEKIK